MALQNRNAALRPETSGCPKPEDGDERQNRIELHAAQRLYLYAVTSQQTAIRLARGFIHMVIHLPGLFDLAAV